LQNYKRKTERNRKIKKSDRVNSAGRACYVVRNQCMVEDGENIIFYYLKEKGDKSGVAIIFECR
jgi:hypothetical protein